MDKFLLNLVFAVIGIGIAYVFGLWLKKRVSYESALLWAIVVGRIALIITDAVVEAITK